ncbi:hypothetical protein G3N57_09150 [Paraburkholderia sp. Se-20369]|nr:hypothetical protein [Paraburkholderia sp. Se-20369]
MTETPDARRETGAVSDGVLQRRHEPVHDLGWTKRLEAIQDFREDGMSVTVPNVHIDDVNVLELRFEDIRTELDAVARKLGKALVGRHVR